MARPLQFRPAGPTRRSARFDTLTSFPGAEGPFPLPFDRQRGVAECNPHWRVDRFCFRARCRMAGRSAGNSECSGWRGFRMGDRGHCFNSRNLILAVAVDPERSRPERTWAAGSNRARRGRRTGHRHPTSDGRPRATQFLVRCTRLRRHTRLLGVTRGQYHPAARRHGRNRYCARFRITDPGSRHHLRGLFLGGGCLSHRRVYPGREHSRDSGGDRDPLG